MTAAYLVEQVHQFQHPQLLAAQGRAVGLKSAAQFFLNRRGERLFVFFHTFKSYRACKVSAFLPKTGNTTCFSKQIVMNFTIIMNDE
jgi:hypothetical protein